MKLIYTLPSSDPTVDKNSIVMHYFKEDSAASGYSIFSGASLKRTINAATTSQTAIFYKSASGQWQVAYRSRGGFRCADITTQDAIKAFSGEKCFEADGKTIRDI